MKLICNEFSLLTAKTRSFRLQLCEHSSVTVDDIVPGKYLAFSFSDSANSSLQRCYTITSTGEGNTYDIIVEDKGVGSASSTISEILMNKKEVDVIGCDGSVTFNAVRDSNNLLLIAGGIGITLPLALIREYYLHYGTMLSGRKVTLMLSCNDLMSVPCLNELIDLHTRCEWFNLRINVTRNKLFRTSEMIRQGRLDLQDTDIGSEPDLSVICGSTLFATAMQSALRKRFPLARVEIEAFSSPSELTRGTANRDALVTSISLKNMDRHINVDRERTVLENLLQYHIPIRNMCRSGICGSCKFRLESGEVRSEPDFCLSATDKAGNIHLACCSYPSSDTAVIEIV